MQAGRLASTIACSVPLLCRIEARRPASWIALATAGTAAAVGGDGPEALAVAGACGGLAALAAVGDAVRIDASPELATASTLARAAWPLAGAVLGCCATALVAARAPWSAVAVGLGIVIVVAARLVAAAAASAAAAWQAVWRAGDPLAGLAAGDGGPSAFGHGWADRLVMMSTLVAMVVCYFLVPDAAAWYGLLVGGLFVLLTVPAATRGPGVTDEAARSLLVRTMPEPSALPGTLACSLRTIAISASLLGWPALVATVLRSDLALVPAGPGGALVLLAALAATTAGITWIAHARGLSGDTTRAVALAAVVTLIVAAQTLLSQVA